MLCHWSSWAYNLFLCFSQLKLHSYYNKIDIYKKCCWKRKKHALANQNQNKFDPPPQSSLSTAIYKQVVVGGGAMRYILVYAR